MDSMLLGNLEIFEWITSFFIIIFNYVISYMEKENMAPLGL